MKVASPLRGVKIVQTSPVRTLDEMDKWVGLFDSIFVRRTGE
jgi:hypothetical protein